MFRDGLDQKGNEEVDRWLEDDPLPMAVEDRASLLARMGGEVDLSA